MNIYELYVRVNYKIISGEALTESEKRETAAVLYNAISDKRTVLRFHLGVKAPKNENGDMNPLYPTFFITPYIEGKKHKILTGATPNTHILSSNSYELEIIRLLILFAGNDPAVIKLKERTCERLCASCFDNDCFIGECYDTGIVSLRFRCTATPDERQKLISLSNKIINHFNDKKRTLGIKMYMFLAFSELPRDLSKKYLEPYRDDLINIYNKYTIESTDLNKYIARNALECLDIKL